MPLPREISMSREIAHLKYLLVVANDTIETQRQTSNRLWKTICRLVARRGS